MISDTFAMPEAIEQPEELHITCVVPEVADQLKKPRIFILNLDGACAGINADGDGVIETSKKSCIYFEGVAAIGNQKILLFSELQKLTKDYEILLAKKYSGKELEEKTKEMQSFKALRWSQKTYEKPA
jgi:hypothetical protein